MPRNACPEPARNPRTVGMSPDHVGRRFDPAYTEVTAFGGGTEFAQPCKGDGPGGTLFLSIF
jgi:hypothetical protein